ncbi:hypothetical protein AK812_SmicGene27648 [Symbiodinium microadriaticum]|nr:hypothetical protein AK812_SmicGene27648 [Symbiodinium microadriaticum]
MGRFTEEQKQQKWREIEEELERIRKEKREQEEQRRQHEEEERKQKEAKQRNLLWKEILLLFGSWHEACEYVDDLTCGFFSHAELSNLLQAMLDDQNMDRWVLEKLLGDQQPKDAAYPQMLDRVWAGAKQATAKHVVL